MKKIAPVSHDPDSHDVPVMEVNKPTIFVSIASYRDPECQWTVKDLFEKAAHPERIFVGICWQFDAKEDKDCFTVPAPYPKQVRTVEYAASKSKGGCWARAQALSLLKDEDYVLQIDAHMRVVQGWDELMIGMLERCPSPNATLSTTVPAYHPPEKLQDCSERRPYICVTSLGTDQELQPVHLGWRNRPVGEMAGKEPLLSAFFVGNFFFAPSKVFREIPFDPHLYFRGQELTFSARLWTSGYDIYQPDRTVIYHYWDSKSRDAGKTSNYKSKNAKALLARQRVWHVLGAEEAKDAAALVDIEKYGMGKIRPLEDFWTFSGVDIRTKKMEEKASQGLWTPYKPPKAKSNNIVLKNGMPRIFVNIASYRDPECQWTVKDMYEKATHPDRIFAGICWQFDPVEDKHCFEVVTRPEQVRVMPVDWREAEGVCWARHHTQQLWEGEEYTLMIDSHMRFVPGWDEQMFTELAACATDKAVLSSSPVRYEPPNKLGTNMMPTVRRTKQFLPDGNIRGQGEHLDRVPEKPLRGAFINAGFSFSRSEIIEEVPFDPYMYFDQEEITYALRLFTHGWDIYSPRRQMLYHYYNTGKESVRPLHWSDMHQKDTDRIRFLRNRGLNRFNHLTGYRLSSDPEVVKELDLYGFGKVRSLKDYEDYTGIDFKNKVASEKAMRALFVEDLHKYRIHPIRLPEIDGPLPEPKKAEAPPAAPKPAPVVQPPAAKITPVPMKMLEVGDFMPLFEGLDSENRKRTMESFAGRFSLVYVLPADNAEYIGAFFQYLQQQVDLSKLAEIWQCFILDGTAEQVAALKQKLGITHPLWVDGNRALARSLGICQPGDAKVSPTGFVLNKNIKIVRRHTNLGPTQLVAAMIADCRSEMEFYRNRSHQGRVISEMAPALIVPNAFSPEMCRKCIDSFRNGKVFEGTVGAEEKTAYSPKTKVRTDHILGGALLEEIDEKLSRSLFPEIKKVFGFEVLHRELYKVGLYTGEKGGFFKPHRDNFDIPLAYRRIAMTLHLGDDYEGGGLRFPEYDETIYRPKSGSAIAFSCATMHEAMPVTSGERFVLVGFFHGEEDEAFRRHYLMSKGEAPKNHNFAPKLRQYPELTQSRQFVTDWRRDNVSFEAKPAVEPSPIASGVLAKPNIVINPHGGHHPKKTFETSQAIAFDDFLPEDMFKKLQAYTRRMDYQRINAHGKILPVWRVHDGFPMKCMKESYCYNKGVEHTKTENIYPTNSAMDMFIEQMLAVQPQVRHLTGNDQWSRFTVASWGYPPGTGLSMHDDTTYIGSYAYFMNPVWRAHWGGMLLLVDEVGNRTIQENRGKFTSNLTSQAIHIHDTDEPIIEHGFAQCIFPKRNRIVFIAKGVNHMVTRVNEAAGDNVRMSLAGFFHKKA